MRIKKIKLKNIRSHKNSEISLEKGISVFSGGTGSGKSSILIGIEYALFGSDVNLSNKDILRRNSQKGYIELEFVHNNVNYSVKRGLKRSGDSVSVDPSSLKIKKDGKELPIIGRAGDLDERILEILNYPKDVKAKEVFEITSYTKQDEIRALVEMSAEKRQEFLDRILQLSKYKTTWENMRDVVSHFRMEAKEIKGSLEQFEEIKKDKKILKERIENLKEIINKKNSEVEKKKNELDEIKKNVNEVEKKRNSELEKRRKFDEIKGTISRLEKDKKNYSESLSELKKKNNEIKNEIKEDIPELEKLRELKTGFEKTIEIKKEEKKKLKKEFDEIKKVGKGKCPVCKQEVTEEHLDSLNNEFQNKNDEIENEIKKIENKILELKPKINFAEEQKKLKEKLKENENRKKEIQNKLKELSKDLEEMKEEAFEFDKEAFEKLEEELKNLKQKETKLISEIESISKELSLREEEIKNKKENVISKENQIKELEKKKTKIGRINSAVDLLSRMREDIRNIREVVRRKFLEDFRQEFQKKFEEIRKYEEEYSVDIKNDYEPVAFSASGEEVGMSSLSGGEKTSVALAYRLALADIAAQISDIRPSELLILDEPTTGFDKEDIKALPESLRNIKTIPQIIIVTHEEELKNAADYKFEVTKEQNISTIQEVSE